MKALVRILAATLVCSIAVTTYSEGLSSRREYRAIGEAYLSAWDDRDFDRLQSLFINPERLDPIIEEIKIYEENTRKPGWWTTNNVFESKRPYRSLVGKIRKLSWHGGHIRFVTETKSSGDSFMGGGGGTRYHEFWLILTPDGKIKYDPILLQHPLDEVFDQLDIIKRRFGSTQYYEYDDGTIERRNKRAGEEAFTKLKEFDIPLFELDIRSSPRDVCKSLEKIQEWLIKNADKLDRSEPRVVYPKKSLKEYKGRRFR